MDSQGFKNHIKTTLLLTEEKKDYFLSKADKYPPELRQKLIEELNRHEQEFIQQGEEKISQIQKLESEAAHQRMIDIESAHRQEEELEKKQAEEQLKTDLSQI